MLLVGLIVLASLGSVLVHHVFVIEYEHHNIHLMPKMLLELRGFRSHMWVVFS